jgi:NIMA (never in mitosis gene a)-related kinase 1/4/5
MKMNELSSKEKDNAVN